MSLLELVSRLHNVVSLEQRMWLHAYARAVRHLPGVAAITRPIDADLVLRAGEAPPANLGLVLLDADSRTVARCFRVAVVIGVLDAFVSFFAREAPAARFGCCLGSWA